MIMKTPRALLYVVVVLIFSTSAFAQSVSIPAEHPSLYKGVRPLGMGNAFIAMKGTDENAPFYNPAAINDYEKKLHFRILSPVVDFSPGVIGLVQDVLDLADAIDAEDTDGGKIDQFRTFVNQHIGQFESVALRLPVVQVQHKWFAASILADSRNTVSLRNRAFTNVEIQSRSDMGGTVGGAYAFFEDMLQVGLNLKILHRLSIDETITSDDVINAADFSDTLPRRRATSVGVDLGLKGTIPTFDMKWLEFLKPTAGITWQDIGNTRFGNGVPDTNQSFSVGFAVHPSIGNWHLHFANDIRELNQSTTFIKKWGLGVEVVPPWQWKYFKPAVQLGGHQGYITAGTTLDFKYGKLEFSTYGEEAGVSSRQKQLRRLALNMSFGF